MQAMNAPNPYESPQTVGTRPTTVKAQRPLWRQIVRPILWFVGLFALFVVVDLISFYGCTSRQNSAPPANLPVQPNDDRPESL
jgi:hypothetical protein